jgi:hypothetical protein
MPLQFLANGDGCGAGTGGSYDFTARVEHRLVVSLSAAGVNRRQRRTRFLLGVHNPDGVPVSDPRLRYDVERLTGGRWFTIARHRPPFAFTWRWPRAQRGRRQSMRSTARYRVPDGDEPSGARQGRVREAVMARGGVAGDSGAAPLRAPNRDGLSLVGVPFEVFDSTTD